MRPEPKIKKKANPGDTSGAEYAGIGLQLAGAVLLFMFAGQWLDRRFGTEPWLLLIGVFVGAGAGFFAMYRQLIKPQKGRDVKRRESEP